MNMVSPPWPNQLLLKVYTKNKDYMDDGTVEYKNNSLFQWPLHSVRHCGDARKSPVEKQNLTLLENHNIKSITKI
jgi:hypothetical protein